MKIIFHLKKALIGLVTLILLTAYTNGFSQNQSSSEPRLTPHTVRQLKNIEGILEIRAAVSHQGKDALQYVLIQENGSLYYLHFSEPKPKNLKTGMRLQLLSATEMQGSKPFPELLVSARDIRILYEPVANAIPSSFGPQRTIVFLINFQDQPNNRPFTQDQIRNTFFTQLNNLYNEFSYQQTTVVGSVIGWYTVALNGTSHCDTVANALPPLAQAAATRAGVDLSSYKRRVYIFPTIANCPWAGVATILETGAYSNAWINGYNDLSLIGHEVGHNLGLYHSHMLLCPNSPNQGSCTSDEYGDRADIMGIDGTGHFNAFQKERLGWLNYGTSPPIRTVTSSGTFTIDAYETRNGNIKALKILKAYLADGSQDYYYLEFRQPIGFDGPFGSCSDCDFTKGVLIHQGNSRDANSSELLDMTPSDNQVKKVTLLPGKSFADSQAANGGVTFKVNSVGSTGASVSVTFGSTPPPPSQKFSYNVILGYPFSRVTINNTITCPSAGGNPVCLVSGQSVNSNIVIRGSNNHLCTLIVQASGNLLNTTPSNSCYVNIQPATTTQAGSISLPSQF